LFSGQAFPSQRAAPPVIFLLTGVHHSPQRSRHGRLGNYSENGKDTWLTPAWEKGDQHMLILSNFRVCPQEIDVGYYRHLSPSPATQQIGTDHVS
jgi:hypothetical protein